MFRANNQCSVKLGLGVVMLAIVILAPAAGRAADGEPPALNLDEIQELDLDKAVAITLAQNPSLAAAQDRVLQAAQAVKQVQSGYWPQLDANAGGSWVDMAESNVLPNVTDPQHYYNVGLNASWLLFNGFARKFSLAAARYGEQSTVQAHADARRQIISAVVVAYQSAQLAEENIAIAKADAEFNNRQLTEARLRYDVGAGALSDVLNFQVRSNVAQTQIILYEYDYQKALNGLAVLLGAPEGRLPGHIRLAEFGTTTAVELESPDSEALIQTALDQRSDIQQLESSIGATEATVKAAKGDYYPSLVLTGGVEGRRPEDLGFEGDDFGSSIALGLSWKLFTGGLTRARVGENQARLSELQNSLLSARNSVAQEIQSIVALIRSAQLQVALQETSTKLVQQQRDLVEKEYKSGVGSLVRLNEAQKELTVAQGRLVLARVALRQAWYSLQAATGYILEMFHAQ